MHAKLLRNFRSNATTSGGASTIHAKYPHDFRWNVVRRTDYSLHVSLPFERYAWHGVYYARKVPSRFALEGSGVRRVTGVTVTSINEYVRMKLVRFFVRFTANNLKGFGSALLDDRA
jgi:hypothetical protein